MKERGILMAARLVRATLALIKRQTRRCVMNLLGIGRVTEFQLSKTDGYDWTFRDKRMLWHDLTNAELLDRCPFGKVGDLLYVRETWRPYACGDDVAATMHIEYRADEGKREKSKCVNFDHVDFHTAYEKYIKPTLTREGSRIFIDPDKSKWKPSIHMPKWASRIKLLIKDIRVERIQDISPDDCIAEGVRCTNSPPDCVTPLLAFGHLWDEHYGKDENKSWKANPWVWVVDYEIMKKG